MKNTSLKIRFFKYLFLILFILIGQGIKAQSGLQETTVKHLDWTKNIFIYEVNIRQYSVQGTFASFERDLPRLKDLGIELLWLMPINPIGEVGRKGKLGSYYSVKDYKAINSEFGTMEDFKHLVKTAHTLNMKVIIDWVPNHTSFDNNLIKEHPEFYKRDSLGKLISPFDWTDVASLDYSKKVTCDYMTSTMEWWIQQTDIDGFRCDAALLMPTIFWNELRVNLDKIKPVFLLGETDMPEQQVGCFDASYDWKFYQVMNDIATGKRDASAIFKHFDWVKTAYPKNSYLMEFTTNHDENSWEGSEYERLGKGAPAFAVVTSTINGMPLIYNGQESAFKKRLLFFDKDTIDWSDYSMKGFYQTLISLKKRNRALWNGCAGGNLMPFETGNNKAVIGYSRTTDKDAVVVIVNLSDKTQTIQIPESTIAGRYRNVFSGEILNSVKFMDTQLNPWQYIVLEKI